MYTVKEKTNVTLYKGYTTKFPGKQSKEVKAHVAHVVGSDITKKMRMTIRCISTMIVRGFLEEED